MVEEAGGVRTLNSSLVNAEHSKLMQETEVCSSRHVHRTC